MNGTVSACPAHNGPVMVPVATEGGKNVNLLRDPSLELFRPVMVPVELLVLVMGEDEVVVAYVDWFTLISSLLSLSLQKPITAVRAFEFVLPLDDVLPTLMAPYTNSIIFVPSYKRAWKVALEEVLLKLIRIFKNSTTRQRLGELPTSL